MPSHSSSRGNFSSGGSHGGGFSFGGGRSHGGFHGPRRPWHFHFFGSPVVISTGAQSGFIFGLFFFIICIFMSITFWGVTSNNNNNISKYNRIYEEIKIDSEIHLSIIENANKGTEGYGTVKAEFNPKPVDYDDARYEFLIDNKEIGAYEYITDLMGLPKYYIIYSFEIDGVEYKGETFAQFMSSEIHAMGGQIMIAYSIDDGIVDSINLNYSEEKNFEIFEAKQIISDSESSLKVTKIIAIVVTGMAVAIILIIVLCFVRTVKKSKQEKLEEAEDKKFEREQILDSKKKKYCVHCGSQVEDGTKKCPSCGSSRFERK